MYIRNGQTADPMAVLRRVGKLPRPDRLQFLADLCCRVPEAAAELLDERNAMLADELPPSPSARATLTSRPAPNGGRYRLEKVQCGKQCSTCAEGPEHGPYWYLYYRRSGKLVSRYIGKRLPGDHADAGEEAESASE